MTQEQQEQLTPEDHSFYLAHGEVESEIGTSASCPDGFCPVTNLPVDDDLIDEESLNWFKPISDEDEVKDAIDEDYIKAHKVFDL